MPKTSAQPSHSQIALDLLRELIFSGELPAGTDHLESELAQRLNMSRTPIREATLLLEAQGLLKIRARKGVRIMSLTVKDMDEIYEILTELESIAAFSAARGKHDPKMLSKLKICVEKMERSIEDESREAWANADENFHNELVKLGGNKRIQLLVENFNDQVRRVRNMTLYLRPLPSKSNQDHRELYDAIAAGKATEARKIHRRHRIQTGKMLIELLKNNGFKYF